MSQYRNKLLQDRLNFNPSKISNQVTMNQFQSFSNMGFKGFNIGNDVHFQTQSPSDPSRKHENDLLQVKKKSGKSRPTCGGHKIRPNKSQSQVRQDKFNQQPQPEEKEQEKPQPKQNHPNQQSSKELTLLSRQQDETLKDVNLSASILHGNRFYPFNQNLSCCIVTENQQFALQIVQNLGVFSVALRPFDHRNKDQKFRLRFFEDDVLIMTRQNQILLVRYNSQTGHPNIQVKPSNQNPLTFWRFRCRQIQSHNSGTMSGRYKICLGKYFLGVVNESGVKQARLIEQLTYNSFNEKDKWIPPQFWKIVDV